MLKEALPKWPRKGDQGPTIISQWVLATKTLSSLQIEYFSFNQCALLLEIPRNCA
jgi:hypothetical protein